MIGDLADNRKDVGRFVKETEDVATTSAERRARDRRRPAAAPDLPARAAADDGRARRHRRRLDPGAARPQRVGRPAHDASSSDLGPFAERAAPNVRTLAKHRRQGAARDRAATPTVAELTKTTEHAPELANNLAIVLKDLDDRNRAVEKDPRSPGGKGYTGFEAVLQYIFDQMRWRSTSSTRTATSSRSTCPPRSAATTRTPTRSSARSSRRTRASSAAASRSSARTSRASPRPTRPTPASTTPARRAPPSQVQEDEGQVARRTRPKDKQQERARPAGPQEGAREAAARAAAVGNKLDRARSAAERARSRTSRSRASRRSPALPNGAGGQSTPPDPQALLDYLLSP